MYPSTIGGTYTMKYTSSIHSSLRFHSAIAFPLLWTSNVWFRFIIIRKGFPMHVYQSHVKFTSKPSHLWVKVMPCWSMTTHTLPEEHVQQVAYAKPTPVHVHLSQGHHNDANNSIPITNPNPMPSINILAMYHKVSPKVNLSCTPPNPIFE